MDFEKYTFSFYMRNKSNPFNYEVPENEKERFYEVCNMELTKNPYNSFFCFETINGLQVCVSLKHMQFAYNLVDPDTEKLLTRMYSENNGGGSISISMFKKAKEEEKTFPEQENLHIYLHARKEILKFGIDDPVEAFNIIDYLGCYPDYGLKFLSFTDIDGETVMLNPEDVMVLELPRDLYAEGYTQLFLSNQDNEENEEGEPDYPDEDDETEDDDK